MHKKLPKKNISILISHTLQLIYCLLFLESVYILIVKKLFYCNTFKLKQSVVFKRLVVKIRFMNISNYSIKIIFLALSVQVKVCRFQKTASDRLTEASGCQNRRLLDACLDW